MKHSKSNLLFVSLVFLTGPTLFAATPAEKAASYFKKGTLPTQIAKGLKSGLTWMCHEVPTVTDLTDEEAGFSDGLPGLYSFSEDPNRPGQWIVDTALAIRDVEISKVLKTVYIPEEFDGDFIEAFRVTPQGNLVSEISFKKRASPLPEPSSTSAETDDDHLDFDELELEERPDSLAFSDRYAVAYRFCDKKYVFDANDDMLDEIENEIPLD